MCVWDTFTVSYDKRAIYPSVQQQLLRAKPVYTWKMPRKGHQKGCNGVHFLLAIVGLLRGKAILACILQCNRKITNTSEHCRAETFLHSLPSPSQGASRTYQMTSHAHVNNVVFHYVAIPLVRGAIAVVILPSFVFHQERWERNCFRDWIQLRQRKTIHKEGTQTNRYLSFNKC